MHRERSGESCWTVRAGPKTGSVGGESASRVKKVGGPGRDVFKMN